MSLTLQQIKDKIDQNVKDNTSAYVTPGRMRDILLSMIDYTSGAVTGGYTNGGNAYGAVATFGLTDNYGLDFLTNNTVRGRISSAGNWRFGTGTVDNTYKIDVQGKTQSLDGYYVVHTDNLALKNVLQMSNPNAATKSFKIQANTYGVEGWNLGVDYGGSNIHGFRWNPTDGIQYVHANGVKWGINPTTGNVLVNTTTDGGYKFTVNGTSNFKSTVRLDTDVKIEFTNTLAYINANGGGVMTIYGFNGINFIDGSGAFFTTSTSSGPQTSAGIPRPLSIGTTAPHVCAGLQVRTDYGSGYYRGLLIDPLTTTGRDAISTKQPGLIVYNSSTGKFQGWDGTTWNDFH